MILLKVILWMIATLLSVIFADWYFIPFIKRKFTFWTLGRKMRKMAKKHKDDPELNKKLNEIADGLIELNRNETLDSE